MDEDVRNYMHRAGVWNEIMCLLGGDNERLHRAAVETMANMTMCSRGIERLKSESGDQDIRLFVMFAQSDDVPTQRASAAALAIASTDLDVATKISKHWKVDLSQLENKDGSAAPSGDRSSENKFNLTVFDVLLHSATTDSAVRERVKVILQNMKMHKIVANNT